MPSLVSGNGQIRTRHYYSSKSCNSQCHSDSLPTKQLSDNSLQRERLWLTYEGTGPPDKLFFTYLAFLFSTSWTSCECFSFEWTFSSKTQTWGNLWTCQEAEGGLDIGSWRNFMETSSWEALKKGCLLLAAPSTSGSTYLRNVLSSLPEASTQRTFF